jgi:hypothetical protein
MFIRAEGTLYALCLTIAGFVALHANSSVLVARYLSREHKAGAPP